MNKYFNILALIVIAGLFAFSGCEKKVNVSELTIYPDICVIQVGETMQLTAIVLPDDADDKSLKWTIQTSWMIDSTAAPAVASISDNGKVTALAEGMAIATGITNNMFCEASTTVYVGYAAVVDATYTGTLTKNKTEHTTDYKVTVRRISEFEARFFLHFVKQNSYCDVKVDYKSEKIKLEGDTTIELEGVLIPVKVSGTVTLDDLGGFEIKVGGNTYEFTGTKDPRSV